MIALALFLQAQLPPAPECRVPSPECRATEIRALGRSERASAVTRVALFLKDPSPIIRAEAAWALAQIAKDSAASDLVAALLQAEADGTALGARHPTGPEQARALGRVPGRNATRTAKTAALFDRWLTETATPASLVEIIRGAESFARINGRQAPFGPVALGRLEKFVGYTSSTDPESAARVRRAAVATLIRAGRRSVETVGQALGDPDAEVRRLGVLWAATAPDFTERRDLIGGALADPDPMVRLEALRTYGRYFQATDCGPVLRSTRDRSAHVALEALDLLGNACPDSAGPADALWRIVDTLAASPQGRIETLASWHRGARALVALAKIAPTRAASVLTRVGADRTWQVRAYAARAAAIIGDPDRLLSFAADREDNVREAAIGGLLKVRGHATDSVIRAQLSRTDYQLVLTAAQLLEGTPDKPRAVAALLASLRRLTAEQRENSRDPRIAILERLAEVGDSSQSGSLEPYLNDFDPAVAAKTARTLAQWGVAKPAAPRPLTARAPDPVVPAGTVLRVVMSPGSGGGFFEIELRPDLAPITVARVVALAREGYYDLLTWHRIAANFVIQGGSPNANEYYGDARFLADEVGALSHERGTLGISTRGRHTGDAQLFVNLVDNLRLDFDYTVWGRVTEGMGVVDGIIEGDVIERVEVIDQIPQRRVR